MSARKKAKAKRITIPPLACIEKERLDLAKEALDMALSKTAFFDEAQEIQRFVLAARIHLEAAR